MRPTPKNGALKRFVTFALSLMLVFTSFPVTAPAYGSGVEGETLEVVSVDGDGAAVPEDDAADGIASTGDEAAPADDAATADEDAPAEQAVAPEDTPAATAEEPAATAAPAKAAAARGANQRDRVIEGEVTEDLTYNKSGIYTLTVNGTLKGQIRISGGAKLTIEGNGKINGQKRAGSVIFVEDSSSSLELNGPTVTGGKGSPVDKSGYATNGGGIAVAKGAGFNFISGTVTNNEATAGGGIYIGYPSKFSMSGGTVSNNTATEHEGGGIYINSSKNYAGSSSGCQISGGTISNNETKTTVDWGGGGIFVQSGAKLQITTANISGNTAAGLGGGIAGCPHATIGIGEITGGLAIFGNTAQGGYGRGGWPNNEALDRLGDSWAKNDPGFTADVAMDYYCTLGSVVHGFDGDENGVAWTGRTVGKDSKDGQKVTIKDGDTLTVSGRSLGLTKQGSPSSTSGGVVITGNKSTTHGGGIGCNGTIYISSIAKTDKWSPLNLNIKKVLKNNEPDAQPLELKEGQYTFELKAKSGGKTYTASNDKDGNVNFNIPSDDVKRMLSGVGENKTANLGFELTEKAPAEGETRDIALINPQDVVVSVKHSVNEFTFDQKVTFHEASVLKVTYTDRVTGSVVEKVPTAGNDTRFEAVNTINLKKTVEYGTVGFSAKKSLVSALGKDMDLAGKTFQFTLSGIDGTSVENADGTVTVKPDGSVTAENDAEGTIAFENLGVTSYLQGLEWNKTGDTHEVPVELTLKEVVPEGADRGDIAYDKDEHTVGFTVVGTAEATVDNAAGTKHVKVTPSVKDNTVTIDGRPIATAPIVNIQSLVGEWTPTATKHFLGTGDPAPYTFTLTELAEDPAGAEKLSDVAVKGGRVWTGTTGEYDDNGTASVTFDAVDFRVDGTAEGQRNDLGDHWFLMTEDNGSDPGMDPVAYVLKVTVSESDADKGALVAEVTGTWYAGSVDDSVAGEDEAPVFYNTDNDMAVAFANYAVFAASGAPADSTCLVDPKIIKELDGRTIKPGEFSFKLIEVDNAYDNDLSGTVKSATSNDRYGMVDFDAASPAGFDDDGNPVCLVFTSHGDYWYRVVEDEKMEHDPTVDYSDEVILFHVNIPPAQKGESLEATYEYGHLVDGTYVAYPESENNPTWHPTMTNRVRDIDLRVRKTSVLDRDMGLKGATYGLYLVNDEGGHSDVLLGEATSDDDGWLLYESVELAAGSRYYFKEVAAPGGHTVSEFRSPYFTVAPDKTAPGGLTLVRVDDPAYDEQVGADAQSDDAGAPVALADDEPSSEERPDGSTLLTYSFDGGVYDEATRVGFNKLDTRTREWVAGAKLKISRQDTGEEVASWTSGESTQELVATLDVDVNYVLSEVQAPEGYAKANNVVFSIDSYGKVSLVSGSENGNAEISGETITLFDTQLDAEEIVTENREREVPRGGTGATLPNTGQATRGNVAKTGDVAGFAAPLMGLAAVAVGATALVLRRNRRRDD